MVGRTDGSRDAQKNGQVGEKRFANSNLRFELAPRAWALRDQPAVARTRSTRTRAQASLALPVGTFSRSIRFVVGSKIARPKGGGLHTTENPAGNAPSRA